MDTTLFLDYKLKPISFEKINSEFTKLRCYIMATGKNRNRSHFSKESVEKALFSIKNIPVVAHLKRKDGGGWYVGGHDRQIIIDDDGITVNDLTIPFGLLPESSNCEFVEVAEENGTKVTYLTADILLWTSRYPNLMEAKSDDNTYFNQSMEITVSACQKLKEDETYMDVTEFEFSALCLLGRDTENPEYHTEPCFPSAKVEPYQYSFGNKFKDEFSLMLSELKKLSFNVEDKLISSEKEEEKRLNEKLELIAKYNLKVEDLDFNIEEFSLEDLEAKLIKMTKTPESFSATYNQKREAVRNALPNKSVTDDDGDLIEETYFYIADMSDEYVYVEEYHWTREDYNSRYGRFTYTFDEAEMTAVITSSELEEMVMVWLTKEENEKIQEERTQLEAEFASIKSDFDTYKESYKTKEEDIEPLREFQTAILKEQREQAEADLFAKFDEKLGENDEYKTLKANSNQYEINELSDKFFSILGKVTANFSFVNTPVKIVVDRTDNRTDPYGGLFDIYKESKN